MVVTGVSFSEFAVHSFIMEPFIPGADREEIFR